MVVRPWVKREVSVGFRDCSEKEMQGQVVALGGSSAWSHFKQIIGPVTQLAQKLAQSLSYYTNLIMRLDFSILFFVQGKFHSLLFPIEIQNIHKGKHGSDSDVYDTEGSLVKAMEVQVHQIKDGLREEKEAIPKVKAGLGGARDATNRLSSSMLAASVITTIGEEHLAALGGSLESITIAKLGIIKKITQLVGAWGTISTRD